MQAEFPLLQMMIMDQTERILKARGEKFLCVGIFLDRNSSQKVYRCEHFDFKQCRNYNYSTLPHGRKCQFARPLVVVGTDRQPVETMLDYVDYTLSFCGATLEEYWNVDVDEVIIKHYKDYMILPDTI